MRIAPGKLLVPRNCAQREALRLAEASNLIKQLRQWRHDAATLSRVDSVDSEGFDKKALFALALKNQLVQGKAPVDAAGEGKRLDHIQRLVVIGDSLSDSEGRMLSKSLGVMPSSGQYYEGRFTNGFAWPDFLASKAYLGKPLVNYAEGGAVAGKYSKWNPTFLFISHMERQINKHDFKPGDMAVLALGSNDYMTFGKTDVDKVVRTYEQQVDKLVAKGVKDILVAGAPDLSKTVNARKQPQAEAEKLHDLSQRHNQQLSQMVGSLQARYQDAGVTIRFFDIGAKLDYLMELAEQVEYDTLHNKHEGYIDLPRVLGFAGDARPLDSSHRHLFHDEVHPSQEVHQILAAHMTDFIREQYGRAADAS
ncbi:SGNH/GDSL hydrolase family protein [Chromobacterium sp.]|uniref:SGNH/GDSL hydrolase family protein n=1 Tax=Chromobacterium sp. TaxID=306190 RepID=UPI0035B2EB47